MNLKESRKLIQRIKREYEPYSESAKKGIRFLAHYVSNAYDHEGAYEDGTEPYYFELFTQRQINDIINNNYDIVGSFTYSFISYLRPDDAERNAIVEEFANNKYIWVTIKDSAYVNDNDRYHIPGDFYLACPASQKAYDEEGIPQNASVELCWGSSNTSEVSERIQSSFDALSQSNYPPNDSIRDGEDEWERKQFSENTDLTIKVFRLGMANSTYIKYKNGESLLIDCGKDTKYTKKGNMTAESYIVKKVKPTYLIISHWHQDHCALMSYLDVSQLKEVLVVGSPAPLNEYTILRNWSAKGIKVASFLPKSNPYYLNSVFPGISMYVGLGQTPNLHDQLQKYVGTVDLPVQKTLENNTGIIVVVNWKNRTIIIPADVSYFNWPDPVKTLLPSAERIILPHHSCQVYGMLNVPVNTNPKRQVYISNYNKKFIDWPNSTGKNYHRSFVDVLLSDTSDAKHLYTDDIKNASVPYYMIII